MNNWRKSKVVFCNFCKIYFFVIILFSSIYSQPANVIVHGKITSYDYDSPPICPACVIFTNETSGKKVEASSDENGYYQLVLENAETYSLIAYAPSYRFETDTINIDANQDSLEINFKLMADFGYLEKINFPQKYIDYQKRLAENYGNNAITIKLDSLVWSGPFLKFILSIKNNTPEIIYLLQPDVIYSPFDYIITNSHADTLLGNMIDMYHDVSTGPMLDIGESDLIKFLPFSTFSYEPINVEWYNFADYKPDQYTIRITYEYTYYNVFRRYFKNQKPPDTPLPSDLVFAKGLTLRGKYESVNSISFDNTEIYNAYKINTEIPTPDWIKK